MKSILSPISKKDKKISKSNKYNLDLLSGKLSNQELREKEINDRFTPKLNFVLDKSNNESISNISKNSNVS